MFEGPASSRSRSTAGLLPFLALTLKLLRQRADKRAVQIKGEGRLKFNVKYKRLGATHRYLSNFGLSAKLADDFLTDLIDLNHKHAVKAFRRLVLNRRNPDLDEYDVLDILRKHRLKETQIICIHFCKKEND